MYIMYIVYIMYIPYISEEQIFQFQQPVMINILYFFLIFSKCIYCFITVIFQRVQFYKVIGF